VEVLDAPARYATRRAHYLSNSALTVSLSTDVLDPWMEDTTTAYEGIERAPSIIRRDNRDATVARAIEEADYAGVPYKAIQVSSPDWIVTAGSDGDHMQTLGRYSFSATTVVIAHPGTLGNHEIELAQQAHIFDGYDFKRINPGADPDANWAANVAVDGFELGVANWFYILGSASQIRWSGLR
jgi:hypothetical protein